jgi:PAS domain S-box-containing protein
MKDAQPGVEAARGDAPALPESEHRYRELFQKSLHGYAYCRMLFDESGRPLDFEYLEVNEAFGRITGLAEVVGRKISEVRPGILELEPRLFEIYGRVASTGRAETFEIECKPLGTTLRVSAYCPQPGHFVALYDDITALKQTEAALRESRLRLALVLEGSAEGAWDWVVGANTLVVSKRWREIAGVGGEGEESSYSNAQWIEAIHPDDAARVTGAAVALVEGRLPRYDFEYRLRLDDGTWRWVHSRAGAVERNADGTAKRIAGTLADVSARKRTEALLRESAERHRTILQTSMDGYWLVDHAGLLLEVNEAYCRMSGYRAAELLTMRIADLEAAESAAETAAHLRKVVETGHDRFESRHRRKNGSVFDVEISTQYHAGSATDHMAVFVRDLTEAKRAAQEKARLEAQLQQAQKMESVGRLAGGIAHDFNNMLGVILGHASLAMEEVEEAQPLRSDLEAIHLAATRSAELTKQLLAFARKQTIAPAVLDLNATVAGLLKMLERLLGENVRLAWAPGADLWQVKMDASQIDQILANLCVNGRDSIAGVGTLTIETRNVAVDAAAVAVAAEPDAAIGDYVQLVVSDTGSGMDPATLAHLFEPFFTTKVQGKGTGLGLATVYGIVKQNKGFIRVASTLGVGTSFSIDLPRYVGGPRQAERGGAPSARPRGHETILLVEDEPAILRLTARMLQAQGYQVLSAATPGEALRTAGEHPEGIQLLVSDVVMPEMNGRDLAKSLLATYPKLKRLFMSGYTADVIAHHGVLPEGVNFLQKPFSAEELAAAVRAALEA